MHAPAFAVTITAGIERRGGLQKQFAVRFGRVAPIQTEPDAVGSAAS